MSARALMTSQAGARVTARAPARSVVPGRASGTLPAGFECVRHVPVRASGPVRTDLKGFRRVPARNMVPVKGMLILLALLACGPSGNGPDTDPPAQALLAAAPAPLELRLEAPAQVRAGQPVPLRLVLTNRGDRPVEVELTGQPIAFDFAVVASDGTEVWRRLVGVPIEAILQPRTLAPGQEIAFTDSWDQRTNTGQPVTAGAYRVRGILPVAGVQGGWATAFQTLTIVS